MFEITVKETRTVQKTVGKEWKVIDQVVKIPIETYSGPDAPKVCDVMGYTPEIVKAVEETTTRYEQRVDSLDIAAVIRAVNSMIEPGAIVVDRSAR